MADETTPSTAVSGPASGASTETPAQGASANPTPAKKSRRGNSFELVPDTRGAALHGGLYTLYIAAALVMALRSETGSVWFYVFYFLACFLTFQVVTIVLSQCMHGTPRALVRLEVVGRVLRLTRKNGSTMDLTRDVDYSRRGKVLVVQGRTHDNQRASEVVRQGALPDGGFDELVQALKKFR
ncbi:MAG: hypothetical protein OEW11_05095 [Nitrospirota bacterium]|nr:hypothetical protein [Nitrospirota bacterium]